MRKRAPSGDPGAPDTPAAPADVPVGNVPPESAPSAAAHEPPPPVHVYRHRMVDWFFSTLSEPAPTVRRILDADGRAWTLAGGAVLGVVGMLDTAWMRRLGDDVNFGILLLLACTLGPVLGVLLVHAVAGLVGLTGRWMGGAAPHRDLSTAIASGVAPFLLVLPVLLVGALGGLYSGGPTSVVLSVLVFLVSLWAFFICCATVTEVQKYPSMLKGLVNLLLANVFTAAVLFAAFLVVVFILDSLRPY